MMEEKGSRRKIRKDGVEDGEKEWRRRIENDKVQAGGG